MEYIIIIVVVIALLILKHKYFKKLDKEDEIASKTPGRADFIRSKYPGLIEDLLNQTTLQIEFERSDQIRFISSNTGKIILQQFSGKLLVAYVSNNQLIQQWEFVIGTENQIIINQIKHYI